MNDAATTGGEQARAALIAALDRCESQRDFLAAVDDHPLAFGTLDADDARAAARVELEVTCSIGDYAGTPVCESVNG